MTRKGQRTLGFWLGLFAMLMIYAGPLYSALRTLHPVAHSVAQHGMGAGQATSLHAHDGQVAGMQPARVADLALCGYCELLTLNPPLSLSLDLTLPHHAPSFTQPLPESPLPPLPRRSSGNPRAPPAFHS